MPLRGGLLGKRQTEALEQVTHLSCKQGRSNPPTDTLEVFHYCPSIGNKTLKIAPKLDGIAPVEAALLQDPRVNEHEAFSSERRAWLDRDGNRQRGDARIFHHRRGRCWRHALVRHRRLSTGPRC